MAENADRRWYQFNLSTLMLVTVIFAMTLAWWQQWRKQSAELANVEAHLMLNALYSDLQLKVIKVISVLDLENPEHQKLIRGVLSDYSSSHSVHERNASIGDMELFQFRYKTDDVAVRDKRTTTVVLVRDNRLIDLVSYDTSRHFVEFVDTDGDGVVDAVGIIPDRHKLFGRRIVHTISNQGFVKVE